MPADNLLPIYDHALGKLNSNYSSQIIQGHGCCMQTDCIMSISVPPSQMCPRSTYQKMRKNSMWCMHCVLPACHNCTLYMWDTHTCAILFIWVQFIK